MLLNNLQRTLLSVLGEESDYAPNVAVEKSKYYCVLDKCAEKHGQVDLALTICSLCEYGYIERTNSNVLGPLQLTELGLLAATFDEARIALSV